MYAKVIFEHAEEIYECDKVRLNHNTYDGQRPKLEILLGGVVVQELWDGPDTPIGETGPVSHTTHIFVMNDEGKTIDKFII